ncbi:MAG: hypothetical protein WC043_05795 [Pseudobdellovibrionaceae bacterium]
MRYLLLLGLVFSCFGGFLAQAQEQRFFDDLPDIPVMEGMKRDPEGHFLFDTASGAIIQEGAFCSECDEKQIISYYNEALGQMGWTRQKYGFWERNGEQLVVKPRKVQEGVYVLFALSPKTP